MEKELCFPVFLSFFQTLLFDHACQRSPPHLGAGFEGVFKGGCQGFRTVHEAHLDQGCQDLGIGPSQLAALEWSPDGKPELEPGVPD